MFSGSQQLKAPVLSTHFDKTPLRSVRPNVTASSRTAPSELRDQSFKHHLQACITQLSLLSARVFDPSTTVFFPSLAAAKAQNTVTHAKRFNLYQLATIQKPHKMPQYDLITPLFPPHRHKDETQKLPTNQFYPR